MLLYVVLADFAHSDIDHDDIVSRPGKRELASLTLLTVTNLVGFGLLKELFDLKQDWQK